MQLCSPTCLAASALCRAGVQAPGSWYPDVGACMRPSQFRSRHFAVQLLHVPHPMPLIAPGPIDNPESLVRLQGSEEQKALGRQVLGDVLECMRIVAVLLAPITPQLSQRMYSQLGFSAADFQALSLADARWGGEHALLWHGWKRCLLGTTGSCAACCSASSFFIR